MSVALYDKALLQKLKSWTEHTKIQVYGPQEVTKLFEIITDETMDQSIKLPILCLRRIGGYQIQNTNKRPMTYDGLTIDSNDGWQVFDESGQSMGKTYLTYELARDACVRLERQYKKKLTVDRRQNTKSLQLNAVPIKLNYQLDIYTRYFEEADQFMRDMIFNLINHPTFTIVIPYNDANLEHISTIQMADTINDNSDISEVAFKRGQFTRLTLEFTIDDAYLWDSKVRTDVSMDLEFNTD